MKLIEMTMKKKRKKSCRCCPFLPHCLSFFAPLCLSLNLSLYHSLFFLSIFLSLSFSIYLSFSLSLVAVGEPCDRRAARHRPWLQSPGSRYHDQAPASCLGACMCVPLVFRCILLIKMRIMCFLFGFYFFSFPSSFLSFIFPFACSFFPIILFARTSPRYCLILLFFIMSIFPFFSTFPFFPFFLIRFLLFSFLARFSSYASP